MNYSYYTTIFQYNNPRKSHQNSVINGFMHIFYMKINKTIILIYFLYIIGESSGWICHLYIIIKRN